MNTLNKRVQHVTDEVVCKAEGKGGRNRKRIISIMLTVLISSIAGANAPLWGKIVETVEVTEKLFSDEPHSKNMVIISADDLDALKINTLEQLFSFFTAVNTSKRGAGETSFDISMRGSNFEQVLVMVDGVPLNNPQTGHFNADFPFSVRDVHRVEIVRGGSSTRYGAGAFAGVVNIILKKVNPGGNFYLSATGGEHKYVSTSLHTAKSFNNIGFRFSLNKNDSPGYYDGQEFDHLKLTAGAFYSKDNSELDLQAGYLTRDFGAKNFYAPYPSQESIKSYFYRVGWQQTFKRFNYSLNYAYNRHEDAFTLDRDRPSLFESASDTMLHYLNFTAAFNGKRFAASVGGEYKGEVMESTTMGHRKRKRGALFFNLNYQLTETIGADAGIRRNIEPDGNSNFTYYSGIYHHIGRRMILRAGYGKSFRLPSFTELYYHSPANIGNADLIPEVSHNYEASLSIFGGKHQSDLSIFYRNQGQLIDWVKYIDSSGATTPWQAVNIKKNDIIGIEATHRFRLERTRTTIILGVERLKAVNSHDDILSKYGLRFPDLSIKANVVQSLGKLFSLAANYIYKRIYRTDEKGHFLNLTAAVPLRNVELSLRADNLFNTIIEEIPGLKIPGRWFYFTVAYKLKR